MHEYKVIRIHAPSENQVDRILKQYAEDGWRYVGLDPCDGMVFEKVNEKQHISGAGPELYAPEEIVKVWGKKSSSD